MQLAELTQGLETTSIGGVLDRQISGIYYDSRTVLPGGLFVAMKGEHVDGHSFIPHAIDRGAVAIVAQEAVVGSKATMIQVKDSRRAMATIAAAFYRNPSRTLRMVGVTGTNGKTTTAFLIKHLLERANRRPGLLGTVNYEIGDRILPAHRTTPESLDLQNLLAQCRDTGCSDVVMEVSSHALAQDRVSQIEFDTAVFTNLTQDHLDFHRDMRDYFEAKSLLFSALCESRKAPRRAVINIDDPYGQQLVARFGRDLPVLTYGMGARAEFRASNFKIELTGTSYQLDARDRSYLVRLPLIGRFNIYNSLAALAAVTALGLDLRSAVLALSRAPQVPGRLEVVPAKRQFQVFVDYAHTPDALMNVLATCRDLNPNHLIVVFGCGGNRDRAKRPLMGTAAEQYADYSIITSDNPRKEEPESILKEIEAGFRSQQYERILDRKEAIARAIALAEPRDIVLIAGKGHEKYQEFPDHTIPFDDVEMAGRALEGRRVELARHGS